MAEAVVRAEEASAVRALEASAVRALEVVGQALEAVGQASEAVGQASEAVVQASAASDLALKQKVPETRVAVDPSEALRVSVDRPFAAAVELDASAGPAAWQTAFVVSGVLLPKAAISGRPRSVCSAAFPR